MLVQSAMVTLWLRIWGYFSSQKVYSKSQCAGQVDLAYVLKTFSVHSSCPSLHVIKRWLVTSVLWKLGCYSLPLIRQSQNKCPLEEAVRRRNSSFKHYLLIKIKIKRSSCDHFNYVNAMENRSVLKKLLLFLELRNNLHVFCDLNTKKLQYMHALGNHHFPQIYSNISVTQVQVMFSDYCYVLWVSRVLSLTEHNKINVLKSICLVPTTAPQQEDPF